MIRAYRYAVTVYVFGDPTTFPHPEVIADHVRTTVKTGESAQHVVFEVMDASVRPVETEDYLYVYRPPETEEVPKG